MKIIATSTIIFLSSVLQLQQIGGDSDAVPPPPIEQEIAEAPAIVVDDWVQVAPLPPDEREIKANEDMLVNLDLLKDRGPFVVIEKEKWIFLMIVLPKKTEIK